MSHSHLLPAKLSTLQWVHQIPNSSHHRKRRASFQMLGQANQKWIQASSSYVLQSILLYVSEIWILFQCDAILFELFWHCIWVTMYISQYWHFLLPFPCTSCESASVDSWKEHVDLLSFFFPCKMELLFFVDDHPFEIFC